MLEKQYSAKDIENKWYSYWMEKNYFHSEPDGREPYTIVIPPPYGLDRPQRRVGR